jgi:hypothetical protein
MPLRGIQLHPGKPATKLAHLVLFRVHALSPPQVVPISRSLVAVQLQDACGKTRSFAGSIHSYSSWYEEPDTTCGARGGGCGE